jgi:hypothetical protein
MSDNTNIPPQSEDTTDMPPDDTLEDRTSRLSGEEAPDLSPEEFAKLQNSGNLNFDARGRLRLERPDEDDPGISLRRRRAWYGG